MRNIRCFLKKIIKLNIIWAIIAWMLYLFIVKYSIPRMEPTWYFDPKYYMFPSLMLAGATIFANLMYTKMYLYSELTEKKSKFLKWIVLIIPIGIDFIVHEKIRFVGLYYNVFNQLNEFSFLIKTWVIIDVATSIIIIIMNYLMDKKGANSFVMGYYYKWVPIFIMYWCILCIWGITRLSGLSIDMPSYRLIVDFSIAFIIIFIILYRSRIKKMNVLKENIRKGKFRERELIIYCQPSLMKSRINRFEMFEHASYMEAFSNIKSKVSFIGIYENSDMIMVPYSFIRSFDIDFRNFKNIVYLFTFRDTDEKYIAEEYFIEFEKKIEEVKNNDYDFAVSNIRIFKNKKSKLDKKMRELSGYRYLENLSNWYQIATSKDEYLSDRIEDVIGILNEGSSDKYLINTFSQIKDSINTIEIFYMLVKVADYIIQNEALYNISTNKELNDEFFKSRDFMNPSPGTWNQYQVNEDVSTDEHIRNVLEELSNLKHFRIHNTVTTTFLKERIITIQNEHLGHGSITYYVSKKYNRLLIDLILAIVKHYCNLDVNLSDKYLYDEKFDYEIPVQIISNGKGYFYCNMSHGITEYICYEDGSLIRKSKNGAKEYNINLGE